MKLRGFLSRCALVGSLVVTVAPLAGCGGGSTSGVTGQNSSDQSSQDKDASYRPGSVGGTISGLTSNGAGLLVNNDSDFIIFNSNGPFSFDKLMGANEAYNVTVFASPSGSTCTASNWSGVLDENGDGIGNIAVNCQSAAVSIPTYMVAVSVSGLSAGNSMILALNGNVPLTVTANGLAVFREELSIDQVVSPNVPGTYTVTIVTPPSGQTCTLANATGANVGATATDVVEVIANCN
jgi:hypothetical protein